MKSPAVLDQLYMKQRARRTIAWVGVFVICAIVATAAYDIYRSYNEAVANTGRELDTQARVIAEQTARSIQAVDVVLKHLVEQLQSGTLRDAGRDELHLYLKEQAVGLVQADGLVVFNPDGSLRAVSQVPPARLPKLGVAGEEPFERMRHTEGLAVDNTRVSGGTKRLVFPLARRLLTPTGEFAGAVGAPGQVEYFERFYRDTYPDPSTRISLLHRDGWLLARHPHAGSMLGKRLDVLDKLLPASVDAPATLTRIPSPVDGLDHFVAVRLVPDYPMAVAVSRDAQAALAPWLAQSIGAALRTMAFAVLAAVLLALVMRQFTRLGQSEERFALAVAGSDDGILDWDIANDRMFASARALSILGLAPDTVVRTRAGWEALLQFHPDDAQLYADNFRRHLEGEIEVREGEYRVRHADGQYRWVRIRGMSVHNDGGQAIRWAGSVSDIDARNRAEEGLRLSEERFALAVAGSNDGIVDWDVVNDRMYSSERAMQILGIESDVTVRTRAQWSALIQYHPDDVQRMRDHLQSFLDGHTELREGEYRVLLPNGKYRWIRHRNKCVRDRSGNPIRVAGSVSDIDAYKRVEGQLLQAKRMRRPAHRSSATSMRWSAPACARSPWSSVSSRSAAAASASACRFTCNRWSAKRWSWLPRHCPSTCNCSANSTAATPR
jgi:PAS domain S-box-containing protein